MFRRRIGLVLVSAALVSARGAMALDPALDVSQYAHTAWKVRDGFVEGEINAVAQTPDGYLWLGTEFGLLRFDGVRATAWQPPSGQHLPSDVVFNLLTARDGTLWIGTQKGLASWKDGRLATVTELAGQSITNLLQTRDGTVWVATFGIPQGKLCAIRKSGVVCYGNGGQFGVGVYVLYEDNRGSLWAGVGNGVWRWNPGPPKFYPLTEPEAIRALGDDESGRLLVGMHGGIETLIDGKSKPYALPSTLGQFKAQLRFFRGHNGSLWIGTADRGVVHIHQGKADLYTQADGLSGDYVNCVFEDREGDIWVATRDGLDRFRDFAVVTFSAKQGLSHNMTTSVLASRDGSVWIGSAVGGLNRWINGTMSTYGGPAQLASGAGHKEDDPLQRQRLGAAPDSLFQDHAGRIWVSTLSGVGYLQGNRFVRIEGIPAGQILSIAEDSDRNLWMAHQDFGLFQVLDGNVVRQIRWDLLGHKDPAMVLTGDPLRGGLWLGFLGGGIAYLKDGKVHTSHAPSDGLADGQVTGLQPDPDGTVWITAQGGLTRLKDGHLSTLTSKDGLPCDLIHGAVQDEERALWLSMSCGLVRISPSELNAWIEGVDKRTDPKPLLHPAVFDISDGVRSHTVMNIYKPQLAKSSDGRLWFLPTDGVSVIDPHRLPFNKVPPPVYIEQVTADRKVYGASSGLQLPPLVHDLTIDYTALSFPVPEKVHFRYKLEGQDKEWREVVNDREVQYSNLRPGRYSFRVTACNNSGVWNEQGAALDFAILPAYYQKLWFRGLCAAAILALFWAVHRLRLQVLERHQCEIRALNERLMKAQEEERTRIAGELHDGVLQQITSLSLSLGTIKRQVPSDSESKVSIAALQKKLIEIGADIRQLSHELHPAVLQESGLHEALSAYCEEFTKTRGIAVFCETDPTVRDLSSGSALCIYRIAQEALGNVAKHSKARHVRVRLTRTNGHVLLTISDDGIGCAPNRSGESGGLGLINMRERVRQLQGTLEFESEPGRGATVRAEVPFRPAR
jgi:signal transduction histidine kinase/ligand-binding sensor domain-containing protein